MKQSFYLIALQITAIFLGGLSTFYVAFKLPASLYAIIGIQAVISSIMLVFSNTGLETIGLRNFLFWKSINKNKQIIVITTQSIFLRFFFAFCLGIIMIFYAFYISKTKFQGNYLMLFLLFIVSGIFIAINDSFALLLKAHNKFLQAIFSMYFVSVFGKIIALLVFIYFGLSFYLYTLISLPIIIFFYLFILTRQFIDIKYLYSRKLIFYSLKQSRHFAFSSYFSYLFNNIDQFLVSIVMPLEIMGVFTFVKQIQGILNSFISNFFDPLLQKTVAFKANILGLKTYLNNIYKWRNIALILGSSGIIIYYFIGSNLIDFTGLSKYPYLFESLFFIFVSLLILLLYKVQYYLIATFANTFSYLKFTIAISVVSLLSFVVFILFFDDKVIFGYLILSNLCILSLAQYTLNKEGGLNKMFDTNSL